MVERRINNTLTTSAGFESEYPFESKFSNINGNKLHYIDQGDGPPVVMIHGNPTWSFYYRNIIKTLSKDFRAIAPDHIGCGFSDKPDAKAYDYTLASRVKDLDTLITSLDLPQKINLIVHDWGGMIGLAWAIDHIERIDRIIITNTSGFFVPEDKKFPLALALIKYLPFFGIPAVLGLNLFAQSALYLCTQKPLPKKVKKGLIAPYNSWQNRIATLKFVQDIPIRQKDKSYGMVDHVQKNLSLLDPSRLMFLWGTKDFVFDVTFLNEFRRRFPRAQTHVFHDAGHYLFEDKKQETCGLIESFLNR